MTMGYVDVPSLKVGDSVGVSNRHNDGCSILQVAKRTATQVILSDGSRWNKYGRNIGVKGSLFGRSLLLTVADAKDRIAEYHKEIARAKLVNQFRAIEWRELSDGQLLRIIEIAQEKSK